jgi:glycosyltransferase involved in cell wall biosynthesis
VHVATRVGRQGAEIEAHGFTLHPLDWKRGSLNPLHVISIIRQVRALYRGLAPDIVHHVALQPSVVGSLAARGLPIKRVNAFTGLGFVFTSSGMRARLVRPVIVGLMPWLLNDEHSLVVVENPDDKAALVAIGIRDDRVQLIPGSGVDTESMQPLPEPDGEVTAAFVGRLLDDKGIRTLVAAHDILRNHGEKLRLLIAGEGDPANPASIQPSETESWKRKPGVELLGHIDGIRKVWERAHIAVLPSRREGLPVSLLEAAAFGRPIVATDVPGCREIARHDVNAFLVPPDDPPALAAAIAVLACDPALRLKFGAAGRRMAETEFSKTRVGEQVVALYNSLLNGKPGLLPENAAGG